MNPVVRKMLKIGGWCLGSLFALVATLMILLAFPGFMFAHQVEYRNLTIHSDEDLTGRIEPLLQRIDAQLATSEINAAGLRHHIFFGHGNRPFRTLQGARTTLIAYFLGIKPAPNYNASWPPYISHVVSLDVPDTAQDALLRQAWPGRFNMTHILTHEVAHSLVTQELGMAAVTKLPMWKNEGYPEYVAAAEARAAPGYSLRASVTRLLTADLRPLRDASGNILSLRYDCVGKSYLKDENGDFWHTCYYLARVLVEYSLDVKHLGFTGLAKPEVVEGEILREMLADYDAGRL